MKLILSYLKNNWNFLNTSTLLMGLCLISLSILTWHAFDIFSKIALLVFGIGYMFFAILDSIPRKDSEI